MQTQRSDKPFTYPNKSSVQDYLGSSLQNLQNAVPNGELPQDHSWTGIITPNNCKMLHMLGYEYYLFFKNSKCNFPVDKTLTSIQHSHS